MTNTVTELINTFEQDDGTAIVHNGDEISYAEFYDDIRGLSSELPGNERIPILCSDNYKLLLGVYAVIYTGGIAVPIDKNLPEDTITRMVRVSNAELVIADTDSLDVSVGTDVQKIETGLRASESTKPLSPPEEESALVLFTSGTTGVKKGVNLSHKNLIQTSKYINEFMGVDEPITEYIMTPVYHSFGFARTRCAFLVKGTIVLDDGQLNPLLAFERMVNSDCNAFSGVPATLAMLIEAGDRRFSQLEDRIEHVEIGSSPMAREHKEYLISNLPSASICMHYGLTEASRTCFLNFRKEHGNLDSVGKPSPGVDVKIVDERGAEVEYGNIGEIVVRGPNVAKGYLEKSLDGESTSIGEWFCTGDIGYKDKKGYIYFKGRSDDIINVGGDKVSPIKIEEDIRSINNRPHEFCVIGIHDKNGIYGEVPVLCTTDESFTNANLQDLNEQLYTNGLKEVFRPRKVIVVNQLPTTDNGKVLRSKLSEQLQKPEAEDEFKKTRTK